MTRLLELLVTVVNQHHSEVALRVSSALQLIGVRETRLERNDSASMTFRLLLNFV